MFLCACALSVTFSWITMYSLLFMCIVVVLAVEIGQIAFNMSRDSLSSDMHPVVNLQNGSKVSTVSADGYSNFAQSSTSIHNSGHLHHSVGDGFDIPMCEGFSQGEWVELDIVLLNLKGFRLWMVL